MGIYEKFNKAKKEIKEEIKKISKEGKGDTGKYTYSYAKLEDIQPVIDNVLDNNNLLGKISMTKEEVVYEVVDLDDTGNIIRFTLPMALKGLMNGSEAQSLGASVTYMRRYALLTFYELSIQDEAETEKNIDRHDIWVIQSRIQRLVTSKSKEFGDLKEFYKQLNIDSKKLMEILNYCNQLDRFEKSIQKLKPNDKQ